MQPMLRKQNLLIFYPRRSTCLGTEVRLIEESLSSEGSEIKSDAQTEADSRLNVLSFGGNGNIGSSVLSAMIEADKFDITMVSRGSWYWDSGDR